MVVVVVRACVRVFACVCVRARVCVCVRARQLITLPILRLVAEPGQLYNISRTVGLSPRLILLRLIVSAAGEPGQPLKTSRAVY